MPKVKLSVPTINGTMLEKMVFSPINAGKLLHLFEKRLP